MASIDAVLAMPKEKVAAMAAGPSDYLPGAFRGSSAPNPYGTLNRAAFGAAPTAASAPLTDGAGAALDAVEGTGRENYDAGPAEDGLTLGQRIAGLPAVGANMVSQAA